MTANDEFKEVWDGLQLPSKERYRFVADAAGVSIDTVRAWRVATGRSGRTIPESRLKLIKREIARTAEFS